MTACCDVCQHPACWKAEIDIRRSALRNEFGYFNSYQHKSNSLRYDTRCEAIVEVDGSLPTYKTLDLLASGFPSSENSTDLIKENVSRYCYSPQSFEDDYSDYSSSERKVDQSTPFNANVNKSLTHYIKKLHDVQIKVENLEEEKKKECASERVIFKTLKLEDVGSFGDDHTKIYTWIPGEKSKRKSAEARETKEKVLALKMIDGAELPNDCSLSDENKHHQKISSQQAGYSYRRRTVPYHIPPLGSEDRDEYMQLLRYIDLTRLKFNKISNNEDVRIPSPLQTNRVKLYDSLNDNKLPKHISRTKYASADKYMQKEPGDEDADNSSEHFAKTMYIRNGVVLSKSPASKIHEFSKVNKRTPLPLTRVSVPKKVVRKLPLFDHCSSSIKKKDLPDVTMQPITSSENSSAMSLEPSSINPSLSGVIDLSHLNVDSSPELSRVPPCSPLSLADDSLLSPKKSSPEFRVQSNGVAKPITNPLEKVDDPSKKKKVVESPSTGKVPLGFERDNRLLVENKITGPRVTPSTIMISKASTTDNRKEIEAPSRLSPCTSLGSKGSLDGWLLDKDIISRTYDKYQSFSPFKTPQCSAHLFKDDGSERSKRTLETRMRSSKRKILPPSLHNLDQFLPGDEESLRPNTSYSTRCLSPSRSMFIRQQKQPPIDSVPSEITISRFPLLPAIAKSQKSMRSASFNHRLNETENMFPDTPGYAEETSSYGLCDDFDEEVEVLINKEAFSSAFDPFRYPDNLQTADDDFENMANGSDFVVYSGIKDDHNTSSLSKNEYTKPLNVSNEEYKSANNYLLQRDQNSSNYQLLLHQEEAVSSMPQNHTTIDNNSLNLPHMTSNVEQPPDTGKNSSTLNDIKSSDNTNGNDNSIRFWNENVLIAPGKLSPSDKDNHLSDKRSRYSESPLEIRSSEHFGVAELKDIVSTHRENLGSGSSCDSMKPLTPISTVDNITPTLLTPISESNIGGDSPSLEYLYQETAVKNKSAEILTTTGQTNNLLDDPAENYNLDRTEGAVVTEPNYMESVIGVVEDTDVSVLTEDNDMLCTERSEKVCLANATGVPDIRPNTEDVTNPNNLTAVDASRSDNVSAGSASPANNLSDAGQVRSGNSPISNNPSPSPNILLGVDENSSSISSKNASSVSLSVAGSQMFMSASNKIGTPQQSVMKDIFNSQYVEKSSLYLTPTRADDFTEGLDLDLELEDEIVRAMQGIEEFVLDNYEVENNE